MAIYLKTNKLLTPMKNVVLLMINQTSTVTTDFRHIFKIMDYSQNPSLTNLAAEKIGDAYHYSPLNV